MKRSLLAVAIPAVALAAATAGGANAAAGYSPSPAVAASTAKVELSKTNLGQVLANGRAHTVYLFGKDKRGSRKSTCFGACATAWPPLTTTGKPKAGRGVSSSKLGTINRGHGVKQVTYNGHPLYLFQGDAGARQTHGEGINAFGGVWHVLSAAGKKAARDT